MNATMPVDRQDPRFAPDRTHDIQLPSGGIPYEAEDGSNPVPEGRAIVRQLTGADEAILNSKTMNDQAKIDRVLESCTRFPNAPSTFTTKHLLMTDRLVLLFAIRTGSLGAAYRMDMTCPSCRAKFTHDIDLMRDVDVEEMPRVHKSPTYGEPDKVCHYDPIKGIPCTLPDSGATIYLRLLTGVDEEIIIRETARGEKSKFIPANLPGDRSFYLRLALCIKSFGKDKDGNDVDENVIHSDPKAVSELCEAIAQMSMRDTAHIDRTYAMYDVGINNVIEVACASCGEDMEVPVSLTGEFFRPTNR